jgi:hypothetical protein
MLRMVRTQVLVSIVSMLTLGASVTLSVPTATAAAAHSSKKSKGHKKKKKKAVKKAPNATVTAGTETLTFNATAAQALEKAKVSTTVVSPATGALSSGFVFPIAGGTLNPVTGLGSITTTGGITFATSFSVPGLFSSESNATAAEPALKLSSASTLSLTSAQVSPPTFPFATVKGVHPSSHAGAIALLNMPVSLTSTGAQFLGQFATGAFTAGEAIGTITVQVTASH